MLHGSSCGCSRGSFQLRMYACPSPRHFHHFQSTPHHAAAAAAAAFILRSPLAWPCVPAHHLPLDSTRCCCCCVLFLQVALGLALVSLPTTFELPVPSKIQGQEFDYKTVKNWYMFVCVACGLWGGLAIGLQTEYFTSNRYRPVQVRKCRKRATVERAAWALGVVQARVSVQQTVSLTDIRTDPYPAC